MILVALLLAGDTPNPVEPSSRQWTSLNHDFACNMRLVQGQAFQLSGSAKETVTESNGQRLTNGTFSFRSSDPAWRFLSGSTKSSGGGLLASHTLIIDNIDDPAKEGFKPYSLELSFANRLDGVSGAYGYALLREQGVATSRVQQGSEHPIAALGICMMTPKAEASK